MASLFPQTSVQVCLYPSNFLPLLTSFSSKTTPHLNTRTHKKHRFFVITQNHSFRFPTIWHSRITRRHVGPFHLQCLARTNPVTGPSAPCNRPPNYTCPPPCSIQQLLGNPLVRRSVPRGLSLLPSRGMNEPVYESKGTLTVWIDRCWDGAKCELAEDKQVLLHVWRR